MYALLYILQKEKKLLYLRGNSEEEVLKALFNARCSSNNQHLTTKEAKTEFRENCPNGYCDYIRGKAIKVNFGTEMWKKKRRIKCRGYNNELDLTKYRVCYPMTTAQEALKPLVENPPPSVYPDIIKYYKKIGVLD